MTQKKFKKTADDIAARIVHPMGYCLASNRITVDGMQVGYMYRENPDEDQDSGWRFFAGDENDEYANNPDNIGIYDVNTIAHYDNEIIPFLESPYNSAFGRNDEGIFVEESFDPQLEDE